MQREGAAVARLALDADEAPMPAHRVIDDRETEAGALRAAAKAAFNAVELAEDLFLIAP